METISNADCRLRAGDVASPQVLMEIAERPLRRLDSYERMRGLMRLEGAVLHIGTRSWDLSTKRNIYLCGAGKACNHMAMAVDHVLGGRLTCRIAIVKIAEPSDRFGKTDVFVGGHPLPNDEGLRALRENIRIVDQSGPRDLFLCIGRRRDHRLGHIRGGAGQGDQSVSGAGRHRIGNTGTNLCDLNILYVPKVA
ncbi:DUF4147 domain-containing protein [bacterium]|nr:DUF4147 domain-containing protein [bacterium]